MTHEPMPADGFAAVLEYLELSVDEASIAFGVSPSDIIEISTGAQAVPFLVSLATVLMCESPKAKKLALEHGRAMRSGEPTLADVMADATGIGVMLKGRPKLHLVE